MSNGFVHIELRSPDLKKATPFYEALFGWKMQKAPVPGMEYTLYTTDSGPGGGMMQAEKDGTPHWVPYVHVTDIHAALKKAEALGAKARTGVNEIPGFGHAAVLSDPAGSPIALFQPKM
jgi:predicted enzyme related to lactoylglutathione lyase